MDHWEYHIFLEERCHPQLGRYDTYGIEVCAGSMSIALIHDVTTDHSAAEKIAERFTKFQLSPIHFSEAVEDILAL